MGLFLRETETAPCTVTISHRFEELSAHVRLDNGAVIYPGDTVQVQGPEIMAAFGELIEEQKRSCARHELFGVGVRPSTLNSPFASSRPCACERSAHAALRRELLGRTRAKACSTKRVCSRTRCGLGRQARHGGQQGMPGLPGGRGRRQPRGAPPARGTRRWRAETYPR